MSRFTSAPAAPYVVTLRAGCCSPLRRDAARRGLSSSLTHSDVTPSIELQFPGCAAMRCGPQLRTSVGKVIYWRAGEDLSTVEQGFKKRARTAVRLHARPPQRYRIVCACGGFLIKTKVSKTLVIRGFCAAGLNSELLLQECPCVHTNTHTHTHVLPFPSQSTRKLVSYSGTSCLLCMSWKLSANRHAPSTPPLL